MSDKAFGNAFAVGLYERQEARAERLKDHADVYGGGAILRLSFVIKTVKVLDNVLVAWVFVNRVDETQNLHFVTGGGNIAVITVSVRLANSDKVPTSWQI